MTATRPSDSYTLAVVRSPAEFAEALALRIAVFCDEQGIAVEIERDAEDDVATHVVIRDPQGRVVGTGRVLRELSDGRLVGIRTAGEESDAARIGRMAVAASERKSGVGARVIAALEGEARSAGLRSARLHAQLHAAPFYLRCGYEPHGPQFEEVSIPHVEMVKRLEG